METTAEGTPGLPGGTGAVPARGSMPRAGGRAKRGPLTGEALYVYGVVKAQDMPLESRGLNPQAAVRLVSYQDISALVSDVPLAEFGEAALAHNLKDLEWVKAKIWAHNRVLQEALNMSPVIPMKFATLFLEEGRIVNLLAESSATFRELLDRLSGRAEWGVKMYGDTRHLQKQVEATSSRVQTLARECEGQSEGVRYLLEQKRVAVLADEVTQELDQRLQSVFQRLGQTASEGKWGALSPPALTGKALPMLFNGLFLVRQEAKASFHKAAALIRDEVATLGWQVEEAGPFPPYSFVDVPLGKEVHQ